MSDRRAAAVEQYITAKTEFGTATTVEDGAKNFKNALNAAHILEYSERSKVERFSDVITDLNPVTREQRIAVQQVKDEMGLEGPRFAF